MRREKKNRWSGGTAGGTGGSTTDSTTKSLLARLEEATRATPGTPVDAKLLDSLVAHLEQLIDDSTSPLREWLDKEIEKCGQPLSKCLHLAIPKPGSRDPERQKMVAPSSLLLAAGRQSQRALRTLASVFTCKMNELAEHLETHDHRAIGRGTVEEWCRSFEWLDKQERKPVRVELNGSELTVAGTQFRLSPLERRVVDLLLQQRSKTVSFDSFKNAGLARKSVYDTLYRLRSKLSKSLPRGTPPLIAPVPSAGYRLN